MTGLVVFTVVDVLLLIAGLAFYLFWVGSLLTRIAGNLEECAEIGRTTWATPSSSGPGSSTSTRPAAWSPARCRAVRDGRGHRDRRHLQARAARGARTGPACFGDATSRLHDAFGFAPKGGLSQG